MFGRKKLKKFNPEDEKKLREEIEAGGGLEKKDVPAMLLSAFLVFIPISLIILVALSLLAMLLFGAF